MTAGPRFDRIGSRLLVRGKTVSFSRHYLRAPDGAALMREVVHHPGSVVVAPVVAGDVIMLRQFRAPVGDWIYELPAGKRDVPGEPPEMTAARECEEETGFRPGRLVLLHRFFNTPGYCDEHTWLYLAEDLTPVGSRPQGAEERAAEVVRLPLEEAVHLARRAGIVDAKTLIGIYALEAARS